jgi:pyrimidine-nucleoside phosphorylase
MSKKLAAGSDAIVLDVKCGEGAFMKDLDSARELSEIMVGIGSAAGRETIAMITDMSQPLGNAVGNSLEVQEAIDVLSGRGPADIRELSEQVAGAMIYLGGRVKTFEEGAYMARQALQSGAALEKFRTLITTQGGEASVVNDYDLIPASRYKAELTCSRSGYVQEIDAQQIGIASQRAGAGRATKEDSIDPGAGILLSKKVGDKVRPGDVLATVFAGSRKKAEAALAEADLAYQIGADKVEAPDLIKAVIRK